MKYNAFMAKHPDFDLHQVGFVRNINEYFLASDIIVGKQGANTMMEAIYLHRPCLISELLYTAELSARYLKENGIGWSEDNTEKQVGIVERCMLDKDFEENMEANFNSISLQFGSDDFCPANCSRH